MGGRCVLCGVTKNKVAFFMFPKKEHLRRQWASFCGMEIQHILRNHALCSGHFMNTDWTVRNDGVRRLKRDVIPSVKRVRNKRVQRDEWNKENNLMPNIMKASSSEGGNHIMEGSASEFVEAVSHLEEVSTSEGGSHIMEDRTFELVALVSHVEEVSTSEGETHLIEDSTSVSLEGVSQVDEVSTSDCGLFTKRSRYNEPRFVGDITLEHVNTPSKAARTIRMVQQECSSLRKRVRHLVQSNMRLTRRLRSLSDVVRHLKDKDSHEKETAHNITVLRNESLPNKSFRNKKIDSTMIKAPVT